MSKIPPQRKQLIDIFVERNSQINLSAIREPEEIYHKHILDALELTKLDRERLLPTHRGSDIKQIKACDLGTWWGFPLLPLAITYLDIQRTGLDARNKKITAINDMIKALNLNNCKAVHARVEEHTQKYDIVTARAVAYADTLLPWVDCVLRSWWLAIFYKLFTTEEDEVLEKYWRDIKIKHMYTLWSETERILYVIKKPKHKKLH